MVAQMIYELRIDCFFTDKSAFDDIVDKLEDGKDHMTVVNPGQLDQQCSIIEQIKCYHDEDPHLPCPVIDRWDNCPSPY